MAAPAERRWNVAQTPTPYEQWVKQEGVPIVRGHGITDLAQPEFKFWDRLGCEAYFILLQGMEGFTGMFAAQIPAGGTTNMVRHLYEKVIYIVEGSGITTLEDPQGKTQQFERPTSAASVVQLHASHSGVSPAAGNPVIGIRRFLPGMRGGVLPAGRSALGGCAVLDYAPSFH